MDDDPLERLRALCLALPETTERLIEDAYRMVAPRSWTRSALARRCRIS